jgi:hypothetical protein
MSFDVCDAKCQKQKRLAQLKSMMETGPTPEAKQQARLQYYTLQDGQGWLKKEKEKVARAKILPVVQSLERQHAVLQEQIATQNNQLQNPKADEVGDEEETRFIKKQLDEANVMNRMFQLSQPEVSSAPSYMTWLPYLLDGIIALLGLVVIYFVFIAKKLNRFIFSQPVDESMIL